MAINVRIGTAFNSKGLTQAQSQFQKFGKSIRRGLAVGAVVAGTVAAIGAVGIRFAKMAEEAQAANNRLDQIAHSMGLFGSETGKVTNRLKAFAEANELTLAIDADIIKNTQSKLMTFKQLGQTADEAGGAFDRATMAALDLAAAGFGQAETNAVQLGKALQDPIKGITALTRSGVTFTESEKQVIRTLVESGKTLEAQEMILSAIEAQVGGTAEATVTSSAKMSLAFNRIADSIGTAVLPMLDMFSNWLVEITPQIESFFGDLTDPTTEVGEAWLGMQGSVIAFGDTIGSVWAQIDSSGIFTGLLKLIETVMVGLSQLVWVAGDAGKTLGLLFSGDFAGAGQQFTSFFTRYNTFVDQLYNKIDNSAAALAASASRRFEAVGVGGTGGTGTGTGIRTAGGSAARAASSGGLSSMIREANANGRKVTNAARRETKLANAGLSKEVAAWINTNSKPAKAANSALGRISRNGTKAITNITNAYNRSAAGMAAASEAAAQAAADASAAAAAAAEAAAQAAAEAAQREADALAERQRIYQSFVDSVTGLFASLKSSIMGAFNLSELGGSTSSIIRNMKRLIDATRSFSKNITQLSNMGLNPDLLQQVITAGPMAGARLASALVAGGSSAIAEISQGFSEFSGLSSDVAMAGVQSRFGTSQQQSIYNITVNGGVGSGATIGQAIVEAIKAYERTSGAVWQGA
jgi:hypothetical protein